MEQSRIFKLMEQVIGFDTVSHRSNLEMAAFLAEGLEAAGMKVELIHGPDGDKACVYGVMGPPGEDGLMLAGHMDVVPVEGQAWSSDPFKLTLNPEGRLVGRGVVDMKSFLALSLEAVEGLRAAKLKKPLMVGFTYDEEVGCEGAGVLMAGIKQRGLAMPQAVWLGEPTGWGVYTRHKGLAMVRARFTGLEGHSSRPHKGASAAYAAARLVVWLEELAAELAAHPRPEAAMETPHTTLNVGVMHAGTAVNIIPNKGEVWFEYRTVPGDDPLGVFHRAQDYCQQVLLPRLQAGFPQARIELALEASNPPMLTPEGSPLERLLLAQTGQSQTLGAPYFTEGSIYNRHGALSVVCGPGFLAQAHKPDEWIDFGQLEQGQRLLNQVIREWCGR